MGFKGYSDEQLEEFRRQNEYRRVRRLPDGSVTFLQDLAFTRAILLGSDVLTSYTRRYCFENRAWADREFALLTSKDDEPEGWIATRPER